MDNLISIIMPVKNGSNYLSEAIMGIKKQNVDTEIIVVDDGSTDDTVKIAQDFDCKVVSHGVSKGQIAGKNTGLNIAAGNFILFHDHDDVLADNALQTMLNEFKMNSGLEVVNAKIKDFISQDATDQNQTIKTEPYWGCLGGAMLIKKEVFDKIGLFDENIKAGEIIALTSKFQEHNIKVKKIDFISSYRRIHDTNFGKTQKKTEFQDYASLLRAKLAKK